MKRFICIFLAISGSTFASPLGDQLYGIISDPELGTLSPVQKEGTFKYLSWQISGFACAAGPGGAIPGTCPDSSDAAIKKHVNKELGSAYKLNNAQYKAMSKFGDSLLDQMTKNTDYATMSVADLSDLSCEMEQNAKRYAEWAGLNKPIQFDKNCINGSSN